MVGSGPADYLGIDTPSTELCSCMCAKLVTLELGIALFLLVHVHVAAGARLGHLLCMFSS